MLNSNGNILLHKEREDNLQQLYSLRFKAYMNFDQKGVDAMDSMIARYKEETEETLHQPPLCLEPYNEEFGDKFTAKEWCSEWVRGCSFIPSDGDGYWGTEEGYSYSHYDIFGVKPKWATHVAWFNK